MLGSGTGVGLPRDHVPQDGEQHFPSSGVEGIKEIFVSLFVSLIVFLKEE